MFLSYTGINYSETYTFAKLHYWPTSLALSTFFKNTVCDKKRDKTFSSAYEMILCEKMLGTELESIYLQSK